MNLFRSKPAMQIALLKGPIHLVDAHLLRRCLDLKEKYEEVWIQPTSSVIAPVISLELILQTLGSFKCFNKVLGPTAPTNHSLVDEYKIPLNVSSMPDGTLERIPSAAATLNDIVNNRPSPLVLLTGCFDLLHPGHFAIIERASMQFACRPVVALLTSNAIRRQPKNRDKSRPSWNMNDRLLVLNQLRSNPIIVFINNDDSLEIIRSLRPDIFVKEVRDKGRDIVEQEACLVGELGGRCEWLDTGIKNLSSSAIHDCLLSIRGRSKSHLEGDQ